MQVILIIAVLAIILAYVVRRDKMQQSKTGVVENIELTFGSKGHQWMTIDGEKYATWIDYTKWPTKGETVTHHPYMEDGMQCTRIDEST